MVLPKRSRRSQSCRTTGKWLFTLHNASRLPFLQYAENRPLREKMYKAYINRGNNNDKNDNKETIRKIVSLRLEKARLLGFNNYANFVLDETMSKNDSNVMSLLNNLWSYALPKAKAEAAELQQLMDKEGKGENWKPGTGGTTQKNSAKRNTTSPKKTPNLTSNWRMYVKELSQSPTNYMVSL